MIPQPYPLTVQDEHSRWWYVIGWHQDDQVIGGLPALYPVVVPMGEPAGNPMPRVLSDVSQWDTDPAGLGTDGD